MKHRRVAFALVMLCFILIANIYCEDIVVLSQTIKPLAGNEVLQKELYIIKGEPNYCMVLYRTDGVGKQIIDIVKNAKYCILSAGGKTAFWGVGRKDTTGDDVWMLDGIAGQIKNLGTYFDFAPSVDGKYIAVVDDRLTGQIAGKVRLFETTSMKVLGTYDFNSLLLAKLGKIDESAYFEVELFFNKESGLFEILFDEYGERGPLSCTGAIEMSKYVFTFTDRKAALLKEMGF